jgi:hypothetical protein
MLKSELVRRLRQLLKAREEAAEKAESVGAFKMLMKADHILAEFVHVNSHIILTALEKHHAETNQTG